MNKRGEFGEPFISERKVWNQENIIFAIILAVIFITAGVISLLLIDFNSFERFLLGFGLVVVYAIILFFLIEPTLLREVRSREIQTIERPVIRTIEKPIEKIVEKFIDRPVYVDRPQYIDRPRYINKIKYVKEKHKKLNIPRYNYVGSSEAKVYHKRLCRLGKLIKKKYKVSNNSESYFKKHHFKPCKVCILHKKKV